MAETATAALPLRRTPGAVVARGIDRALERWPHIPGLSVQLAIGLWLTRRLLHANGALPAGTDTLGFISRAAANARGGTALSPWSAEALGATRSITLESALGLATKLTGDPVLTVTLFMLTTLVASGAGAYLLSWRWFGRRTAATAAGALYLCSQLSLSQTASGHLNVTVAVALAPVVLGLGVECIERFDVVKALGLSLAVAALLLARIDVVLYLAPFLALYPVVLALAGRDARAAVVNAVRTGAVALPVAAALTMYQLVPLAGGVRASWLTSSGIFTAHEFDQRSLEAFPSLLGFAREIGYLAFTGQQTWYSHPWLPFAVYAGLSAGIVALAYAALRWHRDPRALFLGACAVAATLLGKGFHAPAGGVYAFAVAHVPVFGNLRDPNRWLIVQALAYAVLAGLALDRLSAIAAARAPRISRARWAAAATIVLLVPVAPTVLGGLRTWKPRTSQIALLRFAGRDGRSGAVATLPYDQTRAYIEQPGYAGWEHDLGAESGLWTGRPGLADGGWNPAAAGFVAHTTDLLRRGDPAFAALLAQAGVGDVVDLATTPTAPHLIDARHPDFQRRSLAGMHALAYAGADAGGRVLHVTGAAAPITVRSARAVVLGGRAGLAALTALPGVDPSRWAAQDAGDVLARGGLPALLGAIRGADLVVAADERPVADLAVAAATPLAQLPGATSNPGLYRETQTVANDAATRLGDLTDDTVPAAQVATRAEHATFSLARPLRAGELWVRARARTDAARLALAIDGRPAGSVLPVSPLAAGFAWYRVGVVGLRAGSHRLALDARRSSFGAGFDVDEVRLVDAAAVAGAQRALSGALSAAAPRVAHAYDVDDTLKWLRDPALFAPGAPVTAATTGFWSVLRQPAVTSAPAPGGGIALTLDHGRRYHTLVEHIFGRSLDWTSRPFLFLRFRGGASGATLRLSVDVDGDPRHRHSSTWTFTDDERGWQTRAFALPRSGGALAKVRSLRVAADDKDLAMRVALDEVRLSPVVRSVKLALPLVPAASARRVLVRDIRTGNDMRAPAAVAPGAGSVSVAVGRRAIGAGQRVIVPPAAPLAPPAPVHVRWRRDGAERYAVSYSATRPVTLQLAQAFDPHWRVTIDGRQVAATPAWGVVNGFALPAGRHHVVVSFSGSGLVRAGAALSLLALAGVIAAMMLARRRRGAAAPAAPSGRSLEGPGRWALPWRAAFALLALALVAVAAGSHGLADALTLPFAAAAAAAIVLAARAQRRSPS